ncbi:MAG: alpha,alpha-trehalase, partial [Clostridia bacterium]|nr:alpha,alpha-trehalase [Clostridia bacterium]
YFDSLYYWDTYFTNKALFETGDVEQAKNNVLNILYLIDRFGYMLNANRMYFLKHSQPPYAALMVDDVFRKTNDVSFLKHAFAILKKEYDFWMTRRISPNGLNRYDCEEDEEGCKKYYLGCVADRVGTDSNRNPAEAGRHYYAEGESGWDFSPRFGGYCADCNPVDLNSNLYLYEKLFSEYEALLGEGEGRGWAQKAKERAAKINTLLWDRTKGIYKDYNFVTNKHSDAVSAASFQPYFVRLAGEEQRAGLEKLLQSLESDWGIFTTERTDRNYQWAYPNIWAPCQYVAVTGLKYYGYEEESNRIAKKYAALIEKNFAEHGKLFEKYNGITGNIDAASEYGTPEMLGWTAGVYLAFKKHVQAL